MKLISDSQLSLSRKTLAHVKRCSSNWRAVVKIALPQHAEVLVVDAKDKSCIQINEFKCVV